MKHIVPVSGGKDSQAVLSLVLSQVSAVDVIAVHQSTGYDHPETYKHLAWMENFYKVNIHHTYSKKYADVFDFIRQAGYFPNSAARGCTSRLKQRPFGEFLQECGFTMPGAATVYLGMRADESARRKDKYGDMDADEEITLPQVSGEYAPTKFGHVKCRLPIVDWTTKQVFEYLEKAGAKINPLYARGHKRVGCYPCLLADNNEWELAAKDSLGREHIQELLSIEKEFKDQGNPRKLIRIHETRDVKGIMARNTPCDWCNN